VGADAGVTTSKDRVTPGRVGIVTRRSLAANVAEASMAPDASAEASTGGPGAASLPEPAGPAADVPHAAKAAARKRRRRG
jgi:hypothetical protein